MENKKIRRTIVLEEELYTQLKIVALKERISIQKILYELIKKFVDKYGK